MRLLTITGLNLVTLSILARTKDWELLKLYGMNQQKSEDMRRRIKQKGVEVYFSS